MRIRATLNKSSLAHKIWRGSAKISGEINGVTFKITHGMVYVTDPLEPEQVERLANIKHLQMEIIAPAPTIEAVAEAPVAPPPASEPTIEEDLTVEKENEENTEEVAEVEQAAPEPKKQRGRPKKSAA